LRGGKKTKKKRIAGKRKLGDAPNSERDTVSCSRRRVCETAQTSGGKRGKKKVVIMLKKKGMAGKKKRKEKAADERNTTSSVRGGKKMKEKPPIERRRGDAASNQKETSIPDGQKSPGPEGKKKGEGV